MTGVTLADRLLCVGRKIVLHPRRPGGILGKVSMRTLFNGLLVVLLCAVAATGQAKMTVDEVRFAPAEGAPGGFASTLHVTVTMAPGWHIYGLEDLSLIHI